MLNWNNNKVLFNVIKLLWAIIIFYLWIKLSVYFTWEKISLVEDSNHITWSSSVDEYDNSWKNLIKKHEVAALEQEVAVDQYRDLDWEQNEYLMKFQNICLSNISFCAKIKFQWELNQKDKYMYLASAIYVLKHLETNLQLGKPVKTQLKKITINTDSSTRRWFANWDTVTINLWMITSYVEFFELVVHEIWHVTDLGIVRWLSDQKSSTYTEFGRSVLEIDDPSIEFYKLSWQSEKVRNSSAKKEDFCSGYGMTNPFEDFAECHNLYLNHNAVFRYWAQNNETMKQKYNFMANLYWGSYMFDSSKDLDRAKLNWLWRPWDTTKM